jgi:UDP-3-O-[3-hydroxymyristoyl] glucosamine N-acyltransferase
MTVNELAELIGGEVKGDGGRAALGVCPLDDVREGFIVYLEKQKEACLLDGKEPAAVLCSPAAAIEGQTLIRCAKPKLAFALALEIFHPPRKHACGVHPSAVVEAGAEIDPTASIGPNCYVGEMAKIGSNTVLRANVALGPGAVVGNDCLFHPNAVVLNGCVIGDRVILHSGAVIGSDGFGFLEDRGKRKKIPQTGRVVIGDDVEIGANSAVDRATLGETRIGSGTKIDNLVQVGHNVHIGENCVLCGQVGIAGSCEIGSGVIFGGQAGVSDHVNIGDNALIGAQSGVICDVPAGLFFSGYPARPHRENMKTLSLMKKLPELVRLAEKLAKDGQEDGGENTGN